MTTLDLKQIETFLAIAKYKSFTKSAEELYISQSTVSSRLKALEDELDIKLVNRQKGHTTVELTDKGIEFIDIARQWMEVYEKTQMLTKKQKFRTVRYAGPESINQLFGGFYKELMEKESTLSLYVRTCQSSEVTSLLREKSIDVGFTYIYSESKDIYMKKIGQQTLDVVMKTDYEGSAEYISVYDLADRKEVQVRSVVERVPEMAEWHGKYLANEDTTFWDIDNPITVLNTMEEGTWCLQPRTLADKAKTIQGLRVFKLKEEMPKLTYYLAVVRSSMQNNHALKLLEKYVDDTIEKA